MLEKNKISAEHIKAKVIDYLLTQYNDILIGNELTYGTKRKAVDLLMLKNNHTTAIEVKSDSDKLNRLEEQVSEYILNFNSTIICITKRHYHNAYSITPKAVGIMLYSDDKIVLVRKPTLKKRLDKIEMLSTIPTFFLRKYVVNNRNDDSDIVRIKLTRLSINKIQAILNSYLSHKLGSNFSTFISERGISTHVDDIPTLSSFYANIE